MRYNEAGVKALHGVRSAIDSAGLPLLRERKLNGILNAIEMQIEDYDYDEDVVKALVRAMVSLAERYELTTRAELDSALAGFERNLERRRRRNAGPRTGL
jgi:hypothetical protein